MAPLLESPPTPPESSDSESLSPARDALQHNLETNLTPNKKKSWLNIGGTIRKSALSIKGAIDYVRGEQSKPQDEDLKRLPSEESTSLDSTTAEHSETPKRPRMTERRSTFTPKHAVASLRQHLPRHSKRGSTHSIFKDKDTTNEAGAEGPERFSTDSHDDKEAATHTRRTSIADSIVGSVRGFGLKVSLKKAAMPGEVQLPQRRSPERSAAAAVPLPSSPINIPNAPPALSLNLGPAGFISPAFGGSPGAGREEELMYLTAKPTQSNMFHLKLHDLDFDPVVCPTRRDGLSTPMPGTNVALELDGGCESPPFFERNVELAEHSPARSDLGLRQVRSIDAMAQSRAHVGPTISSNDSTDALANAAVIAHAADEAESRAVMANVATSDAAEATLAVIEKLDTTAKTTAMAIDDELLKTEMSYTHTSPADHSPKSEPTPAPLFIPMEPHSGSRRNLTSASAVNTCPPDMAPLSRQTTPRLIDVDHGDIERWQQTTQEPSQADRYAKQQEGRRDSVVEVGAVADRGPPSPNSSVNLPYRFKAATGTSELSINASKTPPAQLTCRMIEPSPSPYVQSTEHEQVLPASNQYNDTDSVLTDYAEFKTQHIFRNDDEVLSLPDYDNASGESSPDGSPIMPLRLTRLYEAATGPSRTPSPTHGVALRSTDVGSVFWKFSVSGWLGGEGADATEASLDDVDDDSDRTEKDNSHICPSSTEAHRTPSMGSRLDFELQRSDRNMRYNAPQAESAGHVAEDSERPESSTWTFCLNQTVQEIELPLSDPVHTFATRSARIAQQKSGHGKENSVDAGSLTSGGSTRQMLESAVRDTNYAEAMLMDGSEDHNSHHHPAYANAPDAVQTSSPVRLTEWERQALQTAIPSQAYDTNRPFLRNDRSPKRITQAELILPATLSSSPMGGITSGGFSPTASIREVSSNRFAALDDDNMPSSPPEPLARYESHGRAPGGFKLASQAVRHEYGLPAKPSDFLVGMNSPNSGYEADSSASAESPETSPLGREQVGGRARYRNLPSAARGE